MKKIRRVAHSKSGVAGVLIIVLLLILAGSVGVSFAARNNSRLLTRNKLVCPQENAQEIGAKPDLEKAKSYQAILDKSKQDVINSSGQYLRRRSAQTKEALEANMKLRKKYLIEAMRADADTALSQTLPTKLNSDLAKISNNCIESARTVEGTLEVFHADFFDDKLSDTYYILKTQDNQRINLHPAGIMKDNLQSGTTVKVKGIAIDNDLVFDASGSVSGTSGSQSGIDLISGVGSPVSGDQKIAIVMVNFNSPVQNQPTVTHDQVKQLFAEKIQPFYRENSYDKISISFNIFGIYTLPISHTCDYWPIKNAAINAADKDVHFANYNRLVIIGPFNCGWSGLGDIGQYATDTPSGQVNLSTAWIPLWSALDLATMAHELGHNFGNHHANFLNCGDVSISESGCTSIEYGDSYDVMGGVYPNLVYDFNAAHKEYLGWFDLANVKTITEAGNYELEPIETNTTGLKAIKIPRGNNDFLYVEYRQPIGFDKSVPIADVYEGALLHVLVPPRTGLIDPTPGDRDPNSGWAPQYSKTISVKPGQSFTDPATGTIITTVSATPALLRVHVNLRSAQSTPTPSPFFSPTPIATSSASPDLNRDSDGDGFKDSLEVYLGTNVNLACGINAWPPDFNNDGLVRTSDISAVVAKYGTTEVRYDLNGDGRVTTADITAEQSYYGRDCQ